ncbi:MAG: hypothetical protein NTV49_06500 [Kiritimatiellaeota bacterium]|nr:hypothetical protein [Kiritimatiellota bacterium]
MKKRLVLLLVFMGCAAPVARAIVEIEGYYWFMTPSGTAAVGIDGLAGTAVDLQGDLGYGSQVGVPGARLIFGDMFQVGAEYFRFSMSAENNIHRVIKFSDREYPVDADVKSRLESTFLRGFVRLNFGSDMVHGGFLVGGQYMAFNAQASSTLVGSTERGVQTGMPIVGAFLEVSPIPILNLRGSVTGFKWDFGNITAKFIELEGSALLRFDPFFAGAGWRYLQAQGTYAQYPVDVDIRLSGPVVFAGLKW